MVFTIMLCSSMWVIGSVFVSKMTNNPELQRSIKESRYLQDQIALSCPSCSRSLSLRFPNSMRSRDSASSGSSGCVCDVSEIAREHEHVAIAMVGYPCAGVEVSSPHVHPEPQESDSLDENGDSNELLWAAVKEASTAVQKLQECIAEIKRHQSLGRNLPI